VLRQTLIAGRLATAAGLSSEQREAVFYTSLLAWVGCVADSHELAIWFGDDTRLRAHMHSVDRTRMSTFWSVIARVGAEASPVRRMTMLGRFAAGGPGRAVRSILGHCQTTGGIAERLGLGEQVTSALQQTFERWDGKGVPGRRAGEQIEPVMRVVHIADAVEVSHSAAGIDAAVDVVRARRGRELDPGFADVFTARAAELLDGVDDVDAWDAVIATEVHLGTELSERELTGVLRVFGDYADLKSPSWLGHSSGVAELAAAAARSLGLPAADATLVERAALVHDLGAIGVSAGVWDKPGALSPAERERVRTHPYLTERTLARPARLAQIGALAALHHERIDGSGYPRGVGGEAIPLSARLLAAADVYHALCEARPHRDALGSAAAAAMMREEVAAGRLDGEAANAVLAAAGHRVRRRPELPRGLTGREVEILVLVARGLSNREVATRLSISARTVGSHIEHIYTKIGVSTRGAAAMFAMRHGLVDPCGEE
jgi:HD-GYP domain-containing protein (c-di-GMP phosphodiesterase class II)